MKGEFRKYIIIPGSLADSYNDLYNIEVRLEMVTATLEQANITMEGLFLNADAVLDP